MKVRIFDTKDGVVTSKPPWKRFDSNQESEKEFMDNWTILLPDFPEELKKCPFIDIEESTIPSSENSSDQLYFDGEIIYENLKRDKEGTVKVYPLSEIKNNYLNDLDDKIEAELSLKDPNVISIIKLQRMEKKCEKFTALEWYEKSIESLDERVSQGKTDKPEIRKKIKAKIKELKSLNK